MPIFKPKAGPVLTAGRICHFLIAGTGTFYCGHLGGYEAAAFGGLGAIVAGFLWELSNRYLDPTGSHPFADAIDFWSFVAGALAGGSIYLAVA